MITANIYKNNAGGLDASIGFETNRAENVGPAFDDTLTFLSQFYSAKVSSKSDSYHSCSQLILFPSGGSHCIEHTSGSGRLRWTDFPHARGAYRRKSRWTNRCPFAGDQSSGYPDNIRPS